MQKMVNSVDIITAKCQSAINLEFLLQDKKYAIQTLLDTGADVNCITYKLAKKLNVTIHPTDLNIMPVGGHALSCRGACEITMSICGKEVTLQFVVLNQIGEYQMILGLPAFEVCEIDLKLRHGLCYLLDQQIPLLKSLKSQWYTEIRSISHIKLAPRTQIVVPVNAIMPPNARATKVSPSKALLCSPLRIPNGIIGEKKIDRIIIANTSNAYVEMKANALIAYAAHSVQEEPIVELFGTAANSIPEQDPLDPTKPLIDDTIYMPTESESRNEYADEEFKKEAHSLSNNSLSEEEQQTLQELLFQFKKLFAFNPRSPGIQTKTKCQVPLRDPHCHPLRSPAYRVSPKVLAEMKKQIEELLTNGIIKKSTSAWAFPVVMVPKPDGTIRFCTDFSKLSSLVHYDPYPLPRIDDTLDKLAGAKYFTTCDAASGYWQIPVEEADQEKLSFITPFGTYSYLVMPMGYCNSSGIFQRAMNETLDQYLFSCCLVYVDDLIIFSPSFEQHLKDLENVFGQLKLFGWKLKLSKCKFAQTTVDFLGHSISHNKITVKKDNLNKLLAMKKPTKVKELQSFMGLANYYRKFIQGFNYIIAPLLPLLKKDHTWEWTKEHDEAFEAVVSELAKYPILRMPDFDKPFILRTDASDFAFGAALVQVHDGVEHPIAFHSGSFSDGQRKNWPTWKREGFAVISAIKRWHHYLSNEKFTIVTDHEALLTILDPAKETKAIINRWRMYLTQYSFQIKHRPGKFLVLEDSISRSPSLLAISISDLQQSQLDDPLISQIISEISGKKNIEITEEVATMLKFTYSNFIIQNDRLYFLNQNDKNQNRRKKRLVLPASKFSEIIALYHDSVLGGHHSADRTYEKLANEYWMPNLYIKVKEYCDKCHTCDKNRSFFKYNSTLIPIVASEPMEILEMDHIGPFREANTKEKEKYVLSVVDLFTKKRWYIAAKGTTAQETYELLVKYVITLFDLPQRLFTDRGTEFDNALSSAFSQLTGIQHSFAVPNPRHESLGAVERSNRTCEDMLRKYIDQFHQQDWTKYLPLLAFAENKAISRAHGFQPDHLMFGREPRRLIDIQETNNKGSQSINSYEHEFTKNLKAAWKKANEVLQEYQNKMIEKRKKELGRRKPTSFKPGDLVWLDRPENANIKDLAVKLQTKSVGPYKILEILENENIKIQITPTHTEVFRPYQLRKAKDQALEQESKKLIGKYTEVIVISTPPLPPTFKEEMVTPPKNLDVETIVGKRIAVYWPSMKQWYPGTVIGYTATKAANLIYYDERTQDAPPLEDFYQAPLFQTKSNQSRIESWKLLSPSVASKSKQKIPLVKKERMLPRRLQDASTDLELAQDLFGTRKV